MKHYFFYTILRVIDSNSSIAFNMKTYVEDATKFMWDKNHVYKLY
jgi:hypothetical protein